MTEKRKPGFRRWLGIAALALTGLCVILAGVSALSNRSLPVAERGPTLSALDRARLEEALQLKATLGDRVWPGWGSLEMAYIAWNQDYEFLLNFPGQPPDGWEPVPGETVSGQPYFRRRADDPQNFAVPVGDAWAASLASKSEMDAFLIENFQETFPPPIRQVFPYRLLIQPSETHIGGLLHESFHVFQIQNAPLQLDEAEAAHRLGDEYDSAAEAFRSEWKQESALLADALGAESDQETREFVREFLQTRGQRRTDYKLPTQLLDYERWLEWEEGVAKYVEVAILREAFQTPLYQPVQGLQSDPDFKRYQTFEQRWSQELTQLRLQSTSGESQFYQTGMAQAFLLDRLLPAWKLRIMEPGVFLEDLLREAVE